MLMKVLLLFKRIPGAQLAEPLARKLLKTPKLAFNDSETYWQERYQKGGTSGTGSYGRLAKFKADTLNRFVAENNIDTVLELGCGDGNQLALAEYPSYIGLDISDIAIKVCSDKFSGDTTKSFLHYLDHINDKYDLTLSLDVIYHLVEDHIFENYMAKLFDNSGRFVIIYSSNYDEYSEDSPHVKHRRFTDWIELNRKDWRIIANLENPFKFDDKYPSQTSRADFFIFQNLHII